ncbi:MAG: ribonuclease III [Oligosphaeraceae bacterium]|nr:ribonuclease III [Oligosphaeraceae bacterium]
MSAMLDEIEELAGYKFKDQDLLLTALRHSSYVAEQSEPYECNQRLEFLGDAVLQLVLSDFLFTGLPDAQEGILSRTRSMLAREQANASYALKLKLDKALLLGNGENMSGGRERPSILGDAFEAFLGAVYLDGGLEEARDACLRLLPKPQECLQSLGLKENPKGMLLEYCQSRHQQKPEYVCVSAEGPAHKPIYEVKVIFKGREIARGLGKNRKNAECDAAKNAMLNKEWEADLLD